MEVHHFEELTGTAVWEFDPETNLYHWSEAVYTMLGVNAHSMDLDRSAIVNLIAEDDRFRWEKAFTYTLRGGPDLDIDKRIETQQGKHIWVNARAKLIETEGKKKLIGVYTEVTEEKRRQHTLNLIERVNTYHGYAIVISELIPHGFQSSGISYINEGFTKITGYAYSDVKGKAIDFIVNDLEKRLKITEGKAPVSADSWMETKKGEKRFLRWTFTPFDAEGLILGVGQDITENKSPEMLLEDAAAMARIGSWEADFATKRMYWSPTTQALHETDPDFSPDLMTAHTFYHPDYRDWLAKLGEKSIERKESFEYEAPIITTKGKTQWVRVMANPKIKNGVCIGLYGSIQDIHQRKITELELTESVKELEDYKFAMDQSAILAITDKRGVILDVNQNFCKIAQYSREEIIGKTHRLINSGYHGSAFFRAFWQTISSGKVWKGEIKNKAKDGSYYWVYTTVVPFMDGTGTPNRYLAIRFEITARKEADEKLLSTLREKNTILESIGDAFFAVDHNWMVTYWNNQAESLLSKKREEIEGKVLWEEYAAAVDTVFYTEYHKALETGQPVTFEAHYDPLKLWLEVSAYPNQKGLSIYFRDISPRKKHELSLIESRERFQKVTQATNDAIWDWDIEKDEVFWGKGFKTLFGYKSGTRKISLKTWEDAIHPEDREKVTKALMDAIADAKLKNFRSEYRFIKVDGTYAHVVDQSVVMRDTSGTAKRMVGAISDVTYRKNYEKSLHTLNEQLENRALELERSNAELEQFAFVASHDLQEPLRMIASFLQQLEKKYASQLDDKAKQYIDFASGGAKRMKEIIADLLAFSRSGRVQVEREPVDLNQLINSYKQLRSQLIKDKKAALEYRDLPVIKSFPALVTQIFHNILDNALKYTKEDVPPRIEVTAKREDTHWVFSISDNGIGIKDEYFDKIFEIFQRLHNRNEYSGTGMGLAIVKKNIEQLKGEVWLESTLNTGTTFSFKIPR